MSARWAVAIGVGAVALGAAALAAQDAGTVGAPADAVLLPSAPGALFGAHISALAVSAGTLALGRTYDLRGARGYESDPPAIHVLEIGAVGGEPRVRLRLEDPPSAIALDAAASRVVVAYDGCLELRSAADGVIVAEVALPGVRALEVASTGTIAASVDGGVVLLAADGSEIARHALGGTASDVMRVYTGEYGPTYHETHPIEVPAQPVAMAFADDGRLAVSMTDGSVHVIDGTSATRLGVGPNPGGRMEDYPAIVTALDVAWSHGHVLGLAGSGALLRYSAGGTVRVVYDGRCTAAETDVLLDTFPDDRSEWTIDTSCVRAGAAMFSPGRVLHFADLGVRVRSARTGASVGSFETLDGGPLALDGDDRLVMANAEGLLRVHALPSGAVAATEPRSGAAGTVSVHPERDLVVVSVNPSLPSDAEEERPWTTRAFHLDGSPRGGLDLSGVTLAVARDADRVAIATYDPFGLRLADLDGRTILDVGGSLPAAEYYAIAISDDGRGLAVDRDGALHWVTDGGTVRVLGTGAVVTAMELDHSARRLAVVRFTASSFTYAVEVIDVATGTILFTAPCGQEVTMTADGTRIAHHEVGTGDVVVRRIDDGAELARLPCGDFGASGLALGPDGALYFSRTIDGLMRWAPPADPIAVGLGTLRPDAMRFGTSAIVVEDGHFGAHVLRASDRAHLLSIHGLVTGGFAVVASTGALDGTTDAPDAFFSVRGTAITRGLDAPTLARFRAPGLLSRSLAGEVVELPPAPPRPLVAPPPLGGSRP